MLNNVISEYLPYLSPSDKRRIALLYAALSVGVDEERVDRVILLSTPLFLRHPELPQRLLLAATFRQFFSHSVEPNTPGASELLALRNHLICAVLLILLGDDLDCRETVPSGQLHLATQILRIAPAEVILQRFLELLKCDSFNKEPEITTLLASSGTKTDQLFYSLVQCTVRLLFSGSSITPTCQYLTVSNFADLLNEVSASHVQIVSPRVLINSYSSPDISALDYALQTLHAQYPSPIKIGALLNDLEFSDRVSFLRLDDLFEVMGSDQTTSLMIKVSGIDCTSDAEDSILENHRMIATNFCESVEFSSERKFVLSVQDFTSRLVAIVLVGSCAGTQGTGVEIRGSESLPAFTVISPLVLTKFQRPEPVPEVLLQESPPEPYFEPSKRSAAEQIDVVADLPHTNPQFGSVPSERSHQKASSIVGSAFLWGANRRGCFYND